MSDLVTKWHKLKLKLEKLKLKESAARTKLVDSLLAEGETKSKTFEIGDEKYSATIQTQYTIPKAEVLELKDKLSKKGFEKAFNVQYTVRKAALEELPTSERKEVDKHITSKDVYAIIKK